MKDSQSRKWMITINNPEDHGYNYIKIHEMLSKEENLYYCTSSETGLEKNTPHYHIFLYYFKGSRRFSKIKKMFPIGDIQMSKGTAQQNRDYVFKIGKWSDTSKNDTNNKELNVENMECPVEQQGKRSDLETMYDMIKQGMTTYEIIEAEPQLIIYYDKIDKIRQGILEERYKKEWRTLDVTYIHGTTGTGKTRGVMERHGYENVYRITDYKHPFDGYKGQDIVVFEEFRSSLKTADMLNYLDGYPVELPARYNNKIACFHTVYITTNIKFEEQYINVDKRTREAFERRIHHFVNMDKLTTNTKDFVEIDEEEHPFDI